MKLSKIEHDRALTLTLCPPTLLCSHERPLPDIQKETPGEQEFCASFFPFAVAIIHQPAPRTVDKQLFIK